MTSDMIQINPFIRYAMCQSPNYPYPEVHLSYDCRIFYASHGQFLFTVDDHSYQLTDGDVLFIPPAHPYSISTKSGSQTRLLVFNFDCECTGSNPPNRLGTAMPESFDPNRVQRTRLFSPFDRVAFCADVPELRAECERIITIFLSEQDEFREMASVEMKRVLIRLAHRIRYSGNTQLKLISKVREYIQKHALESPSNAQVAKEFGYHSYYLNRIMKEYSGNTIAQMMIQERIKYAEMCMATTDMTIAEIAEASGFSNISYFSRLFRAKTGCTPSQYRKSTAI